MKKLFADFFPILLFFVAYKVWDMFVATYVLVAALFAQLLYGYVTEGKINRMHLIIAIMGLVFGAFTILMADENAIKWKATAVYCLMAGGFALSHVIGKKPLVQQMLEEQLELPDDVWRKLSWMWVGFFLFSAVLNTIILMNFSTEFWMNFKLFGMLVVTLAFGVLQGLYLMKYMPDEETDTPKEGSAE